MRFIYATATSLDGFIADEDNSLDWLFAVDGGDSAQAEFAELTANVRVHVEGSTTYRWVVEHERLLDHPGKWQELFGDRTTFVFTSQAELPVVPGADVIFLSGPVAEHVAQIEEAAGGGDVYIVGGGHVAAQFLAAGRLDVVQVSIAPVTLSAGAPLFPAVLDSRRLTLADVHQVGQFVQATYEVSPTGRPFTGA